MSQRGYQKICQHLRIKAWRAGGQSKAQCLDCLDSGLERRLRKERRQRCPKHVRQNDSDFCFCGVYLGEITP